MNTAKTKRPSEGGTFGRELSRAIAQRGRPYPVYQALSDHWTLILQRLLPVWSAAGPGLADPGRVVLTPHTVYLDSDRLLGSRQQILAGTLEPHRSLATFGVAIHEVCTPSTQSCGCPTGTRSWRTARTAGERELAVDGPLLEEPRMIEVLTAETVSRDLCGQDFAASIWVIDPAFMINLVREQLGENSDTTPGGRARLLRRSEAQLRGDARQDQDATSPAGAALAARPSTAAASIGTPPKRDSLARTSPSSPIRRSTSSTASPTARWTTSPTSSWNFPPSI